MLLPIDRVQLVNEKLYVYEFIDVDQVNSIGIQENKIRALMSTNKYEKIIRIDYSNSNYKTQKSSISYINRKYQGTIDYSITTYNPFYNKLTEMFRKLNNESNSDNLMKSKKLGSAKSAGAGTADSYVQGLLIEVYSEWNNLIKFVKNDDNGIEITKNLLGNEPTYGFDFDLYSLKNNVIIEFLKRENNYIDNKMAHPNRYLKSNVNKFKSIWSAAKIMEAELYLVNYSDDENENINVIHVLDIDFDILNPMINHDVGYILEDRKELVNWLKLIREPGNNYQIFLEEKEQQERTQKFWIDKKWRGRLFE